MTQPNIIERAYEIAGDCGSVEEVKKQLKLEGYFQVEAHLAGRQIRQDLMDKLNPQLAPPTRER